MKEQGEDGDAFGISSDDRRCRDGIQAQFASKLGRTSMDNCALMRELPASLMQSMMWERKRPLAALDLKGNTALPHAKDNLKSIVESIMR